MGDSDGNYAAIGSGTPQLPSGFVPETGDFFPSLRSYVLYQGKYRPGFPTLLANEEYGPEVFAQMSIGSNQPTSLSFKITSEWPKNTPVEETYFTWMMRPGQIDDDVFRDLFTLERGGNGEYTLRFTGNAAEHDLLSLIGKYRMGSTTIPFRIVGFETHQTLMYYVEVTQ